MYSATEIGALQIRQDLRSCRFNFSSLKATKETSGISFYEVLASLRV